MKINTQTKATTPIRRVIPVTEWNQYHAWPPVGGLRHLIFYAKSNGFDTVVKRCGGRVLIDEPAFFEWLDRQQGE
jgi:hypothetical protein